MSEGNIIFALIAKGVKPLVSYSNFTGTFDQICINYLKKVGPGTSAAVQLDNGYLLYYLNENGVTFLIMTESGYPKSTAVGCLDSIKKEFQRVFLDNNLDNIENYGLNNEFQTKLRMKFDYFNANKDITDEGLGQLKDELSKMKDEVLNASGLLDERGEKINILDDKANDLERSSNVFYNKAKEVKRAELIRKFKLYGGIACAVLILIYIIICIACRSFTFQC